MQFDYVRSPQVPERRAAVDLRRRRGARAIALAREGAQGNIRPLPVLAEAQAARRRDGSRRVLARHLLRAALRHGARMSELRRTINDA